MKHYLLRLTEEEHYRLKNYAAELDMPIKELLIAGANTYHAMQFSQDIAFKKRVGYGECGDLENNKGEGKDDDCW